MKREQRRTPQEVRLVDAEQSRRGVGGRRGAAAARAQRRRDAQRVRARSRPCGLPARRRSRVPALPLVASVHAFDRRSAGFPRGIGSRQPVGPRRQPRGRRAGLQVRLGGRRRCGARPVHRAPHRDPGPVHGEPRHAQGVPGRERGSRGASPSDRSDASRWPSWVPSASSRRSSRSPSSPPPSGRSLPGPA